MPKSQSKIPIHDIGKFGLNLSQQDQEVAVGWLSASTNVYYGDSGQLQSIPSFDLDDADFDGDQGADSDMIFYVDDTGDSAVISSTTTSDYIYHATNGAAELTGSSSAATYKRWIVFNDIAYRFVNNSYNVAYIDDATDTAVTSSTPANIPNHKGVATSAFGYVWLIDEDGQTLYRSDLLAMSFAATPVQWDLREYWPSGYDEAIAVREWNNFLLVFGRKSILIYAEKVVNDGWTDTNVALYDAIEGIGCIGDKTIQSVGNALWFLSSDGLKSIGRVAAEGSSLSINAVNPYLDDEIKANTDDKYAQGIFSPFNNTYILSYEDSGFAITYDTRDYGLGYYRATYAWTTAGSFAYDHINQKLYYGSASGIYSIDKSSSNFVTSSGYTTGWHSFDDIVGSGLKIFKGLDVYYNIANTEIADSSINCYLDFDDSIVSSETVEDTTKTVKHYIFGSGDTIKINNTIQPDNAKQVKYQKLNIIMKKGKI